MRYRARRRRWRTNLGPGVPESVRLGADHKQHPVENNQHPPQKNQKTRKKLIEEASKASTKKAQYKKTMVGKIARPTADQKLEAFCFGYEHKDEDLKEIKFPGEYRLGLVDPGFCRPSSCRYSTTPQKPVGNTFALHSPSILRLFMY